MVYSICCVLLYLRVFSVFLKSIKSQVTCQIVRCASTILHACMPPFKNAVSMRNPPVYIVLYLLVVVVLLVEVNVSLLQLLLLAGEQRVHGGVELVAALEEVEFEDEDVAHDGAAEFLDEGAGCCSRTACNVSD